MNKNLPETLLFYPKLFFQIERRSMPPKKKEEAKPKPLIGRVGTNLKMGIVGLPNAG